MTYQEFINNILTTRGRFCKQNNNSVYYERHHILPKSCGGTDDKDNLIDLLAREHFIAHKLLAEEDPNNIALVRAYGAMSFFTKNRTEKLFEQKLPPKNKRKLGCLFQTV